MREAAAEQRQAAAEEAASRACAEATGGAQPWKKFVYVEPPKRVKEILEEELYFRRDECQIKQPAAGDRTRNNGLNLQLGKYRLKIRRCFLTVKVVKHRNKLPSGSGRHLEREKKFIYGRPEASITEQEQFTFTT